MYIIEPTKYKTGEEFHYVSDYVKSVKKAWLTNYSLTVSRVAPGIVYNPTGKLIQVELFEIDNKEVEQYKAIVGNRHMTWEYITEVYLETGELSKDITILAPVLKPLNTLFTLEPIYRIAPQLTEWTAQANATILAKEQAASLKESQLEYQNRYCPAAMDI
jgi:hypothetical protein